MAAAISVIVYVLSLALAAILIVAPDRKSPLLLRWCLLLATGAGIGWVAWHELPIQRWLPFWSQDFSFTWLLFTLALGLGLVRWKYLISMALTLLNRVSVARPLPPRLKKVTTSAQLPLRNGAPKHVTTERENLRADPVPPGGSALSKVVRGGLLILLIGIVGALYWQGAVRNFQAKNQSIDMTDQDAYVNTAMKIAKSTFTYIGTRNRMPVYPTLQALFVRPGMSNEQVFLQGRYLNIGLSLLLLLGLGFSLRRHLTGLSTASLLLIAAFSVFIFKAGYFQSELLYYTLSLICFLGMVSYIKKPELSAAVFLGIACGLAHLTKASVIPGMAIFLAASLGRYTWAGIRWAKGRAREAAAPSVWRAGAYMAVMVAFFLVTVFPYIKNSKRIYTQFFYNVNSTFYMWYDSWAQSGEGTRAHGDRQGWPTMPADEIPSLQKYVREHTISQVSQRVVNGLTTIGAKSGDAYGYLKYVVMSALVCATGVVVKWRRTMRGARASPALVWFVALYFAGYLLLYAWYAPISAGPRLVLAQFLPLMYVLYAASEYLWEGARITIWGHAWSAMTMANLGLLTVLGLDLFSILSTRIVSIYGGY